MRRPVSLRGGGRASRKSAASTATAAGSSMRSGKPCSARERRASSAPACRIAARSWSLSRCRGCHRACSSRRPPAAGVRASRADARAGPGTGPPPGRSLTWTAPRPAHTPRPPLTPIAPPPRTAAGAGRSSPVRVHLVMRASPVTSAPPSGAGRAAAVARGRLFPARAQFPANRQARYRPRRRRPARPVDDAAGGFTEPGPVMGIARGSSGAGLAGREAGACPFRPVVAWSHAAGRSFAGHGSASRPVCRPGWSSAERNARVGSGGVYAVSRPVAVRQACSTARSRAATRVSRAAMAWRLRRP